MNKDSAMKRTLAEIGENCKKKGFKLREALLKYDNVGIGTVSYYELANTLETLDPNLGVETIRKLSRPFLTLDEKIDSDHFVNEVESLTKSKSNFIQLLNEILERFEAGETNLFELFMKADQRREGSVTAKQFEDTLQDFGIYVSSNEIEDAIHFLDLNGDKRLDYKELKTAFDQHCRDKKKIFEGLKKSIESPDGKLINFSFLSYSL